MTTFNSDDFNNFILDPQWTFIDPVGDGSYALNGAGSGDAILELAVPDGTHDLWNSNANVVRVIQPAANTDFQTEVKFTTEPIEKFQMQGIYVEQDANNWLRFEIQYGHNGLGIFAARTQNGSSKVRINQGGLAPGSASYLRVSRSGDNWTVDYSGDGNNWTTAGSFTQALSVTNIGPYAGNSGPAFTSGVDYFFNTAEPIIPEDGAIVNQAPIANDDSVGVEQNGVAVINVLNNDTDSDGTLDPSSVTIDSNPSQGNIAVNATTGEITYTPNPNFSGSDSFTYAVADNEGATSNLATVNVNVTNPNAPNAVDDSAITNEDTAVEIAVLDNDSDPDGTLDVSSVNITSNPSNGSVLVNPVTGVVIYTPNSNFNGADSFTYTVNDDGGSTSNPATVNLTINPVNDAPNAVNDSSSLNKNTAVNIDVISNDTDIDNSIDPATVTITSNPNNGNVSVNPTTGVVTYTPNTDYVGSDSFSYSVADSAGAVSNSANVNLSVNEPPPMTGGPVIDVWYGTNQTFGQIGQPQTWVNILGEVNDSDGVASLTYSLNGGSEVPLTIDKGFRITNKNDFNADIAYSDLNPTAVDDVVVFKATDNLGNISTQEVTIDYESGNIWPQPYSIDWSSVSQINDVAQIVDGKWEIQGDTVRTVETGYDRLISLGDISWSNYEITTPVTIHQLSNKGAVGMLLGWQGHNDNNLAGRQPKAGFIPLGELGWYDGENIEFSDTNASIPANLTLGTTYNFKMRTEAVANGTQYSMKVWPEGQPEPAAWDIQAVDSADISGGSGVSSGSAVLVAHFADVSFGDVTVTPIQGLPPVNQTPVANNDNILVGLGASETINVLSNDIDNDGTLNPATLNLSAQPNHGTVSVDGNGQVTYTHNGSATTNDSFTYTVEDNQGATSNVATVNISIDNPNSPTAINDSSTTNEDTAVTLDVVANDTTPTGSIDPSTVSIESSPNHGNVSVNPTTGAVTYTPNFNYNGTDSFSYTVANSEGAVSNPGTVNLTVNAINDAPTAVNDSATTIENTPITLNLTSNDSDVDGTLDTASLVITNNPTQGSVSVNSTTGEVTYTPNNGFIGSDSLTYTINDNQGATSNTAAVNLTVNSAPELFESDDFNSSTLDPQWAFVNPAGDGSYALNGAGSGDAILELAVPDGQHNLWNSSTDAVRVIQPAANTDFQTEVKFTTEPIEKFQMQGIYVEQDANNWLRFEVQYGHNGLGIFAARTQNGSSKVRINQGGLAPGSASYLRVSRSGDNWTVDYSGDGNNWTTAGSFTQALSVTNIGPYAGNAGGSAPAFTSGVDYFFNTAEPIIPEDGLIRGTTNSDNLQGSSGDEIFVAVDPNDLTPGRGELDTLTGGAGADTFVIGDAAGAYYDDGVESNAGLGDYALITDFDSTQQDVIQLHGNSSNYSTATSAQGLPNGVGIYLNSPQQNELIAIVEGVTNLDLNSGAFSFV